MFCITYALSIYCADTVAVAHVGVGGGNTVTFHHILAPRACIRIIALANVGIDTSPHTAAYARIAGRNEITYCLEHAGASRIAGIADTLVISGACVIFAASPVAADTRVSVMYAVTLAVINSTLNPGNARFALANINVYTFTQTAADL